MTILYKKSDFEKDPEQESIDIYNENLSKAIANNEGNILQPIFQGISLGWSDEVAAAALAGIETYMPESMGGDNENLSYEDRYNRAHQELALTRKAFETRNPTTAFIAELGGGLAVPGMGTVGAVAKLVPKASGILGKTMAAGTMGAVEGGLYGAGSAEQGERLEGAEDGVILGAMAGAGLGAAAHGVGKIVKKMRDSKDASDRFAAYYLINGSPDKSTAGLRLVNQSDKISDDMNLLENLSDTPIKKMSKKEKDDYIEYSKKLGTNLVKLSKDKVAVETLDNGWPTGMVTSLKATNKETREAARKMVNIRTQNFNNEMTKIETQSSDILGKTIDDNIKFLTALRIKEGEKLNEYVNKELANAPFDPSYVAKTFEDSLIKMLNAPIIRDKTTGRVVGIDFSESPIRDSKEVQKKILVLFDKLKAEGAGGNARRAHYLKKWIDYMTYEGAEGKKFEKGVERVWTDTRRAIDKTLDETYSEYNKINTVLADIISPLDTFNDSMGRKLNIYHDDAYKGMGKQMRKLLSNYQVGDMERSLGDMHAISKKYGYDNKVDLRVLVPFDASLNARLGSTRDNSFLGHTTTANEIATRNNNIAKNLASSLLTGDVYGGIRDVGVNVASTMKKSKEEDTLSAIRALRKYIDTLQKR